MQHRPLILNRQTLLQVKQHQNHPLMPQQILLQPLLILKLHQTPPSIPQLIPPRPLLTISYLPINLLLPQTALQLTLRIPTLNQLINRIALLHLIVHQSSHQLIIAPLVNPQQIKLRLRRQIPHQWSLPQLTRILPVPQMRV
jgi:hypothetical protein